MAPGGSGKKRARSEASSAALQTESSDLNAALMAPACEQLVTPFNSSGVHDMMVKGQGRLSQGLSGAAILKSRWPCCAQRTPTYSSSSERRSRTPASSASVA